VQTLSEPAGRHGLWPEAWTSELGRRVRGPLRGLVGRNIAARLDGEHQEAPVPHTNRYAAGDNRIDIILDSGAKTSLWWATKNEWLGLIDVAGLDLEALYGGFASEPFTDDSREYVFIARRPPP